MNHSSFERERIDSETALIDKAYDFQAKFIALHYLQSLTESHPEVINLKTISILRKVLIDSEFKHQTQAYFMYKEVANTLCSIVIHSDQLAYQALNTLRYLLRDTSGHPHRATAEALGSLPFSVHGPKINVRPVEETPEVGWRELCDHVGDVLDERVRFKGRSLVVPLPQQNQVLVIKLARSGESIEGLLKETLWMEYLREQSSSFPVRFNIPVPIRVKDSFVFRLSDLPVHAPAELNLHSDRCAVSFLADKDYFVYPNDSRRDKQLPDEEFKNVISRNAWLLGRLSSLGIVHSAPIPLFHNRVQRQRRRDQGLYEWPRAGRLDRWLESCLYPNLGITGVRDFEHLLSFEGKSKALYFHIGVHLMSLLLIAGSYFRNKDAERVGLGPEGEPVDARALFDKGLLEKLIVEVFQSYYRGFTLLEFDGEFPIDLDMLATRMIDEMGVDRHMEEFLRVADQRQMTDEEFCLFLKRRGVPVEEIRGFKRGEEDIVIYSGPHLGEFNSRISIPELIEAVGTMSSLCIAGRYCSTAFSKQN